MFADDVLAGCAEPPTPVSTEMAKPTASTRTGHSTSNSDEAAFEPEDAHRNARTGIAFRLR
jgi:hypothetical protein